MNSFKQWNRFPRDIVTSRSGDTQNPIGHSLEQPAGVDPALSRRVGLDDLQRYLPT